MNITFMKIVRSRNALFGIGMTQVPEETAFEDIERLRIFDSGWERIPEQTARVGEASLKDVNTRSRKFQVVCLTGTFCRSTRKHIAKVCWTRLSD